MVYLFPKSYVRHRSPRNNQGSKLRTKKLLPLSSVLLATSCLPSKHAIPSNTNIAIYRCKLKRVVYLATLWMTCTLVSTNLETSSMCMWQLASMIWSLDMICDWQHSFAYDEKFKHDKSENGPQTSCFMPMSTMIIGRNSACQLLCNGGSLARFFQVNYRELHTIHRWKRLCTIIK